MSTRAQIAVRDEHNFQLLYQHSDGYPDGVLPILEGFMYNVKEGTIRSNVSQSVGWLIVWGHEEANKMIEVSSSFDSYKDLMGWKASFIEPSPEGVHADIEYFYVVDLENKTIYFTEEVDPIIANWQDTTKSSKLDEILGTVNTDSWKVVPQT